MIVFPAIDLRDGKCVRLFQGDYDQTTVFADRPVEVASRWESEGARWLHIVDLDGAAAGRPMNLKVIENIVDAVGISVQVGGGIRNLEIIETVLAAGVKRVILGTAAVEDESMVAEACAKHGEAIAVAIDAKDGFVATRGWRQGTAIPVGEMLEHVAALGVSRVLYTDIKRDGTLTEPDFDGVAKLISCRGAELIVAGGVSSVEHLLKLKELGVYGAVVGKALYTGDLSLRDALARVG